MSRPPPTVTLSPLERFSSRVDHYARYRPGYPNAAIDLLVERCGLGEGCALADLGSGTGILSARLVARGATVYAVEPNDAMRGAAERALAGRGNFISIKGTAECTTLPDASVKLITAAQAFHWFDGAAARAEALRIGTAGARVALLWNERPTTASALLADYEALLRLHAPEYERIVARRANVASMHAYCGAALQVAEFSNEQRFDFAGLSGRVLSSSYAPEVGHPQHLPMMQALRALYERHQRDGGVIFPYRTLVYYGELQR